MSMEHSVTSGLARAVRPGQTGPGPGGKTPGGPGGAGGGFASVLSGLGAEELPAPEAGLADERPALSSGEDEGAAGAADPYQAMAAMIPQLGPAPPQGETGAAEAVAAARLPGSGLPVRAGAAADEGTDAGAGVPFTAEADLLAAPASGKPARLAPQRMAVAGQRTATAHPADERATVQERQQQRLEAAAMRHMAAAEPLHRELDPALLLTAGLGERDLLSPSRRDDKGVHVPASGAEVGVWSGLADGPRVEVPVVAPDPQMMTENQVAEQVSYWVSQGVQNAELELDGLGEGAVQVSIALQGQEARVEFRADQAHVRQVLEDSMPQLRDLLAREGLVLSGVSVGASGADGHGGRPAQEQRRGERQARVAVPELVAAGAAVRPGGASGRSVDLFV